MGKNYTCKRCGCVFPKESASISGYESGARGRHVHCPKCGRITTEFI